MTLARAPEGAPALAAAVVVACVIVAWLLDGLRVDEIARYVGYELVFVVGPGWLLYGIISPGTVSRLRRLTVGWALGLVGEILAFIASAALDARGLFVAYPALVLAVAVLVEAWRTERGRPRPSIRANPWALRRVPAAMLRRWSWSVAGICLLVLGFLAIAQFALNPLPRDLGAITYGQDLIYHLSLAAEALHHWPLTNPNVSGSALPYHWFAHIHMAAAAQVSGVGLPEIAIGLDIVTPLMLLVLELALAGTLLGGRIWAGPLAAALGMFIGELDLSKYHPAPFQGNFTGYLLFSPPFVLGAVLVVPLLILLCERLSAPRQDVRQWILIAILAIGCGGSQALLLPVLLCALILYVVFRWVTTRRIERAALLAASLVGGIAAVYQLVEYAGANSGLSVVAAAAVRQAYAYTLIKPHVPGFLPLEVVLWVLSVPVVVFFMLGAPLIGLAWVLRARGLALRPREALPLAVLAVGVGAALVLQQDFEGEMYFALYGVLAAVAVSAGGLVRFLAAWRARPDRSASRARWFAAVWLAVVIALVFGTASIWSPIGFQALLAWSALLAVTLCALLALARWGPRRRRAQLGLYVVLAVLIAAAVNVPLDYGYPLYRQLRRASPPIRPFAALPKRGHHT